MKILNSEIKGNLLREGIHEDAVKSLDEKGKCLFDIDSTRDVCFELHYLVYWVAAILGALVSGFAYAVYDGRPFFGKKLPFGPINPPVQVAAATKKKKKN